MRRILIPQSAAGRWAALLGALFPLLLAGKMAGVVPFPTFAIGGLGVLAMVVALFAIVRRHERSVWAFLAVAGGVLVVVWTLGELSGPPH